MISRLTTYLRDIRDRQRISIALAKGAVMMQSRQIDLTRPATWEFSGFSQNGEDGIIDVLRRQLLSENRYFIEIGCADGIQNNCAWLLVAEQFSGLMVEGSRALVKRAERMMTGFSIGVDFCNLFVSLESISQLHSLAFHTDPDVMSLDIDGNDYYIARAILDGGFRPKIFVVEYNSVYGPDRSVTVKYRSDFTFTAAHPSHLYYGASIALWRKLFDRYGYRFVTVNRHGVNGFFVEPRFFASSFLQAIRGLEFAENQHQLKTFHMPSEQQFQLIADQELVSI